MRSTRQDGVFALGEHHSVRSSAFFLLSRESFVFPFEPAYVGFGFGPAQFVFRVGR